jgi:hypothetical protein
MRTIPICLALAVSLGACLDAIGPGGDCSPEMRQVRTAEGGGPNSTQRNTGADNTEYWYYDDVVYVFRWGVSYDGCQMTSESFDLMPLLPFL